MRSQVCNCQRLGTLAVQTCARRGQGGARRAGDTNGAECHVGLRPAITEADKCLLPLHHLLSLHAQPLDTQPHGLPSAQKHRRFLTHAHTRRGAR